MYEYIFLVHYVNNLIIVSSLIRDQDDVGSETVPSSSRI